jgi:hypothetical protein
MSVGNSAVVRGLTEQMQTAMPEIEPYQMQAGPGLDLLVHVEIIGNDPGIDCPAYSTVRSQADKVVTTLSSAHGISVRYGQTHLKGRAWYARYGDDPSTSTEVLAETMPLAVCRLAVLHWLKSRSGSSR